MSTDPFVTIEGADTVTVEAKYQPANVCCRLCGVCWCDLENSYDIVTPDGGSIMKLIATEESRVIERACCSPYHALKLFVRSSDGINDSEVLEITKPFRCCCPALVGFCEKEITIRRKIPSSEIIGYVKEPFFAGCCRPTLNMYREKHGRPLGSIRGPFCFVGGCCKSDFEVISPEGNPLASIKIGAVSDIGVRRALLSNEDKIQIQYRDNTVPVDDKIVMLSTLLFLDYLFFAGETKCILPCSMCPPRCWCKLCDIYLCGAVIPCRAKCCGVSGAYES